jgi:hypothetical protein
MSLVIRISIRETKMRYAPTFSLELGTNESATRLRMVGSIFRQWRDDKLIEISESSFRSNTFINVSAPAEDVQKHAQITRSYLPSSSLRRSKFVLRSNILLSCPPLTMLKICKCRYSRCSLVFLHNKEGCRKPLLIRDSLCIKPGGVPRTLVHPMMRHRRSKAGVVKETLSESFQH